MNQISRINYTTNKKFLYTKPLHYDSTAYTKTRNDFGWGDTCPLLHRITAIIMVSHKFLSPLANVRTVEPTCEVA